MAGTRLWTQLSFVIGVLIFIPFAVWKLRPPKRALLPSRRRLTLIQQQLHDGLLSINDGNDERQAPSPPQLALHVIPIGGNGVGDRIDAEAIEQHLKRKVKLIVEEDHVNMVEPDSSTASETLAEQAWNRLIMRRGEDDEDVAMHYSLFLLPADDASGDHVNKAVEWDMAERFGWLRVTPSSVADLVSSITQAAEDLHTSIWTSHSTAIIPPLERELRLTLLSQDPSIVHCTWDASRLLRHLSPALHQLALLIHLYPNSHLVSYGDIVPSSSGHFPPYAANNNVQRKKEGTSKEGEGHRRIINRSSLAGVLAHMEEHVLPAWPSPGLIRPLHAVFFCPSIKSGDVFFAEDDDDDDEEEKKAVQQQMKKKSNDGQQKIVTTSSAVEIEDFGGIAIVNISTLNPAASSSSTSPSRITDIDEMILPPSSYNLMTARIFTIIRGWLGLSPTSLPHRSKKRKKTKRLILSSREMDELTAKTIHARTKEALWKLETLYQLIDRRKDMPVPRRVARVFEASLEALESLVVELHLKNIPPSSSTASSFPNYIKALKLCNQALSQASKAQSDPILLPPTIFPFEHSAAVLLPLILPIIVPLMLGLVNEWKRYKEKVAKKKKKV